MNLPSRPSLQATHLDAIRGLAATVVVFQHARQLFFPDSVVRPDLSAEGLFYRMTLLGGQAVDVFFVLSGFLIAASIRSSWSRGRWSWPRYADARLTRLLVPLVPALLLTAFWDHLGLRLFGAVFPYDALVLAPSATGGYPNVTNFFGNVLFLQGIVVKRFGTNGPLWSLAPEFWYYSIFPLLFFIFQKRLAPALRIGFALLALALMAFIGKEYLIRFPLWLFGAAVAFLPARDWAAALPFRALTVVGLIASATADLIWSHPYNRAVDVLTAASAALFIWSLLCAPTKPVGTRYARVAGFAADVSYTLYLVHFPLLAFLSAANFHGTARWQSPSGHVLATLGLAILAIVYAIGLWYLFERNTRRIRGWLDARNVRPSSAS